MSATNARKRVQFVCMGNICRSPAAEGLFRHHVAEQGLADRFHIESAGTIGYHAGEPPDERMARAARRRGVDISAQRANHFRPADFERFDLILAMDRANLRDILAHDRQGLHAHRVRLFLDFHPNPPPVRDVPDPYYGGLEGFEHVLDLIEASCPNIARHLLDEHAGG